MLDVIIIGAGIAGLSAAVGLAPHGHRIRIFEKATSFEHEGFGMLLIPSAHRVLAGWKIDKDILQAFQPDTMFIRQMEDTVFIGEQDLVLLRKELGFEYPALQVDRSDLHAALYAKIATAPNVHLFLGAHVLSAERGRVQLDTGFIEADLVIASDGIHSVAYQSFPKLKHPEYISTPLRRTARFNNCVLDPAEVTKDPVVADLFRTMEYHIAGKGAGGFVDKGWSPNAPKDETRGAGHILLVVRNKKMISVNSFHAQPGAEDDDGPWTMEISREQYLKDIEASRLAEPLQRLFKQGRLFERWTLGIRDCPTTFVNNRVVLIGDAGHPLNPSIGSGSGLGIEDGACLGVLLEDCTRKDLSRRLKLFNEIRYERCVAFKALSEASRPPGTGTSSDMFHRLCPGAVLPERSDLLKLEALYDTVKETKEAMTRHGASRSLLSRLLCL